MCGDYEQRHRDDQRTTRRSAFGAKCLANVWARPKERATLCGVFVETDDMTAPSTADRFSMLQ